VTARVTFGFSDGMFTIDFKPIAERLQAMRVDVPSGATLAEEIYKAVFGGAVRGTPITQVDMGDGVVLNIGIAPRSVADTMDGSAQWILSDSVLRGAASAPSGPYRPSMPELLFHVRRADMPGHTNRGAPIAVEAEHIERITGLTQRIHDALEA
jgi:hypothetical protein